VSDAENTSRPARNRHGKDRYTAPLVSERTQRRSQLSRFEQIVATTVDFCRTQWPTEMQGVRWVVEKSPIFDGTEVPRFAVDKETKTIIIYRVVIERLTHARRTDPFDERIHIEHYVFDAIAELLGRDPFDQND